MQKDLKPQTGEIDRSVVVLVHGVGKDSDDVFGSELENRLKSKKVKVVKINWHQLMEQPLNRNGDFLSLNRNHLSFLSRGFNGSSARFPSDAPRTMKLLHSCLLYTSPSPRD